MMETTDVVQRVRSDQDPRQAQNQQIHFMKNVAMLGGTLLIARFGAGPFSLDAWWLRTFPKPRERRVTLRPELLQKSYERT